MPTVFTDDDTSKNHFHHFDWNREISFSNSHFFCAGARVSFFEKTKGLLPSSNFSIFMSSSSTTTASAPSAKADDDDFMSLLSQLTGLAMTMDPIHMMSLAQLAGIRGDEFNFNVIPSPSPGERLQNIARIISAACTCSDTFRQCFTTFAKTICQYYALRSTLSPAASTGPAPIADAVGTTSFANAICAYGQETKTFDKTESIIYISGDALLTFPKSGSWHASNGVTLLYSETGTDEWAFTSPSDGGGVVKLPNAATIADKRIVLEDIPAWVAFRKTGGIDFKAFLWALEGFALHADGVLQRNPELVKHRPYYDLHAYPSRALTAAVLTAGKQITRTVTKLESKIFICKAAFNFVANHQIKVLKDVNGPVTSKFSHESWEHAWEAPNGLTFRMSKSYRWEFRPGDSKDSDGRDMIYFPPSVSASVVDLETIDRWTKLPEDVKNSRFSFTRITLALQDLATAVRLLREKQVEKVDFNGLTACF